VRIKAIFFVCVSLILLGLAWISSDVQAAPGRLQVPYPSPTPGPDGRIIYIVKAGDSCEQLSILYGVSPDYLRTTNLLDENCSLREGQRRLPVAGRQDFPAKPAQGGLEKVQVLRRVIDQ